jgi:peptide/nickel transport system substrate-binding protein
VDSGGCASEVRGPAGGLRPSSVYRRRTALRAWCGVIFSACLAACSPADTTQSQRGPILTIGVPESGVNGPDLGTGSLIRQSTLEGLTQVNVSVDGRALPRLAESWSWENSGRRLRLRLRSGVLFHDGTKLTPSVAADAVRVAIDQEGNKALYPSLAMITAVQPDGESELVLDLSEPSAFLPEDLDFPLAIGNGNIGTGPFVLISRDSSGVVLRRFDHYYLGAPEIEEVTIRPFDTLRTAWTSLLRGDLDMVTDVPPEAVEFIQNEQIQVVVYARSYQFVVVFNLQRPPFNSSSLRRALNVAVDRETLIANVLQNQGEPSSGPIWPRHWAYDRSLSPYSFDRDFATTLLDNAGFREGRLPGTSDSAPARLRFTCLLPQGFSLLERIGLEVQRQLFEVGVDVQFDVVPARDFDARIREGNFEAVLVDMISGPTLARPHVFWGSPRREGLHAFGYQNNEAARLFELLRTSGNDAAVRSAVGRLQRVLLDDPPALFLAWNQRARAVTRRFRLIGQTGHDPLVTIRQWTENTDTPVVSTR